MTTPDKEEMPTDIRTGGEFWAEKRDGRWQLQMRHRGPGSSFCVAQINHWADNSEALTTRIVTACNAYEPMREALILAEKADRIHSKCQECEDGAQAPEACGDCFPSADDARVARRNVLKSLGVRMRDVDRARAIKAEPSICNCSQEDVHDYGPCGEDCRSLVVSTLPVNDRHHSGSDSYQADAGAPALSEKVNDPSEWLSELSDASVAEYLGITPEQARIMRLHKLTCPDCVNVHISFPTIRAFHSPLCAANRKCANCGKEMPEMVRGHEVGAICWDCYDGHGESKT